MLILLLCFPFYAHQEHCRQTFSVLQGAYGASTIDKTPKHDPAAVLQLSSISRIVCGASTIDKTPKHDPAAALQLKFISRIAYGASTIDKTPKHHLVGWEQKWKHKALE